VLSVFPRFTDSDFPFGIFNLFLSFFFKPLCCLSFLGLQILISPLVSRICKPKDRQHNGQKKKDKKRLKIPKGKSESVNRGKTDVLSVFPRFTDSDFPFGIIKLFLSLFFRPLCCLSFLGLQILISPLGKSESVNRGKTDNTMI
jgi:hypothetical protein